MTIIGPAINTWLTTLTVGASSIRDRLTSTIGVRICDNQGADALAQPVSLPSRSDTIPTAIISKLRVDASTGPSPAPQPSALIQDLSP